VFILFGIAGQHIADSFYAVAFFGDEWTADADRVRDRPE
jgi:hypothetical protein